MDGTKECVSARTKFIRSDGFSFSDWFFLGILLFFLVLGFLHCVCLPNGKTFPSIGFASVTHSATECATNSIFSFQCSNRVFHKGIRSIACAIPTSLHVVELRRPTQERWSREYIERAILRQATVRVSPILGNLSFVGQYFHFCVFWAIGPN